MGKTGRYKYDPEKGEMVKVSDEIPNICVFDCFCPEGGYWSRNLGHKPTFVESRTHKRKLMRERGLSEANDALTKKEL